MYSSTVSPLVSGIKKDAQIVPTKLRPTKWSQRSCQDSLCWDWPLVTRPRMSRVCEGSDRQKRHQCIDMGINVSILQTPKWQDHLQIQNDNVGNQTTKQVGPDTDTDCLWTKLGRWDLSKDDIPQQTAISSWHRKINIINLNTERFSNRLTRQLGRQNCKWLSRRAVGQCSDNSTSGKNSMQMQQQPTWHFGSCSLSKGIYSWTI